MIGSDGKMALPVVYSGSSEFHARVPAMRLGAFGGPLSCLSYAFSHSTWTNVTLIGVSVFIGTFLPSNAKLNSRAELWANNRFEFLAGGQLGRFVPQNEFNLAVFEIMQWGGALNREGIASVGGIAAAAAAGLSFDIVPTGRGATDLPLPDRLHAAARADAHESHRIAETRLGGEFGLGFPGGVSVTAIRRGAAGMASAAVTDELGQSSWNLSDVAAGDRHFRNDDGVLTNRGELT